VVLLSSGAAPVALAGERCSGNFFSTAPVEDAVHENAGVIARARGYESVYLVTAPGSRSLVETAFQRGFAGPASGVDDGSSAIQRIRQARADAVYVALPPARVRSFLQSYDEAGLFHRIPVIASDGDGRLVGGLGADFPGLIVSARWSAAMEGDRSEKFVAAFERRYGRKPSGYAMQGYDAALLLGEAFRALQGKAVSPAAVARALARQSVAGVAGPLKLGANRFPVTQWHAWELFNDSTGSTYLAARERTLHEYTGPHGERCRGR
jgi:branched-chain amino acid transport system substrate-binding protein